MRILVINCGSSSIKYKLFALPSFSLLQKGLVEKIGEAGSKIKTHHQAVRMVFDKLGPEIDKISAIGHRVVHGGEKFTKPVVINKSVISEIKKDIKLAPLHNPANLEGILACQKILPHIKQVAVFDTSFHQTMPEYAYLYALPYKFYTKNQIRRYGFHGTSHQYVAEKAARILHKPLNKVKLITVHLGNGCSISAVDRGKCVDTSMGFTPLEGLIMGTRCGDIDPAVIFYLARQFNLSIDEIDKLLNKESGLLGISGISNDVRPIKSQSIAGNKRAKLALKMFVYRIKKYVSSYLGVLGGADAVVFTAGIGENNPGFIKEITSELRKFLKKMPKILVVPTNEELMIARLVYKSIRNKKG